MPAVKSRMPSKTRKVTKPQSTPSASARKNALARRTETIKFLTLDETKRLFSHITDKRDKAIFLNAYRHGLRASVVGLLRVEDLDHLPHITAPTRVEQSRQLASFALYIVSSSAQSGKT
jgi:integrase